MVVAHPDLLQYKSRELPRVPHLLQQDESRGGSTPQVNNHHMEPDIRFPFQFIVREHAKSLIAIKELQNEVSSLLVLKDALLETFPHLHQRISGLPQDGRRLQMSKTGEADLSDDIPSSWNTGSMHRVRKIRKSPEGSSTGSTVADSGFSTEKEKDSVSAPHLGGKYTPPEVRWDTWTMSRGAGPPSPTPAAGEDELMSLLDVIHRKAVKLRNQGIQDYEDRRTLSREEPRKISEKSRSLASSNLGAISESSEVLDSRDRLRVSADDLTRTDRDFLVDRISELENETIRSRNKVARLENEIARVSRQKDLLEDQLRSSVSYREKEGHSIRAISEGPGGIIHSVHILTGETRKEGSPESTRIISQSESNLRLAAEGSVNIEIRQDSLSKSATNVSRSIGEGFLHHQRHHRPQPSGRLGMHPSVSVVNLRQTNTDQLSAGRLLPAGSVDQLNRPAAHRTFFPSDHAKYFQNRITAPPMDGKNSPQLRRVLSNEKLSPKSRSVENLYNETRIRSSNSEISLQPRAVYSDHLGSGAHRIKGTRSEQLLTKIGKLEKVKFSDSVMSVPAEFARTHKLVVKPNRERIRQILSTNSVLELQRQLLTTVMENEVYKTQLNKISTAWDGKINEFEKVNHSLLNSLENLKKENDLLKIQMEQKSHELENTRARLNLLERSSSEPRLSAPEPRLSAPEPRLSAPESRHGAPEPKLSDPEPKLSAPEPKLSAPEPKLSAPESRLKVAESRQVVSEPQLDKTEAGQNMEKHSSQPNPGETIQDTAKSEPQKHYFDKPESRLNKPEPWRQTAPDTAAPPAGDINLRRLSLSSSRTDLDLSSRITSENYVKYPLPDLRGPTEPRVTFDLGPKKTRLTEVPTAKRAITVERPVSQLPSDARQRLQELAGQDVKRNYRKTSEPVRPNRLNINNGVTSKYIVSPPATPTRAQSPIISPENLYAKRTSLTRKDSRSSTLNSAKNSLIMNYQNNNVKKASSPITRNAGGNRTRTPSVERSITSKDDKDLSKDAHPPAHPTQVVKPMMQGGRLLPTPPLLESKGLPPNLTSFDIKRMEHDTIAELIAGILQKCSRKEETMSPRTAEDDTESEGSRPQTVLRVNPSLRSGPTPPRTTRSTPPLSTSTRGTPTHRAASRGTSSQKSWEAFNQTDEEVHGSHTVHSPRSHTVHSPGSHAVLSRGTSSGDSRSNTQYLEFIKGMHNNTSNNSQDSLALPDSLNEFEGEEFQSPAAVYPDSLSCRSKYIHLGVPDDIDSLQLDELEKTSSHSPDSLNQGKLSPQDYFDSITLEDKRPGGVLTAAKRRIVPFCENSLSSGNSVFTSQDASLDSKESSPTLNKIAQSPSTKDILLPDLTLSIRPLSDRSPAPAGLQNRFAAELRYKDDLLSEAVTADQTKDLPVPALPGHPSSNLKTGISYAKQATERLKWKFLGW